MRKAIVATLAMVVILGMASPALAGDPGEFFTDAADWDMEFYAEAAYWLGRMGIFVGDESGNLLPEQPLTRVQMAVVLSRMTGQESTALALSGSSTSWTDDDAIPVWGRGYMALAEARGWFVGHADGSVGPNDYLTFEQIAILLARVTDNEDLAVGSWPASAMIAADEMGLFDDIESAATGLPILRGEMVSATLQAMVVDTFLNRAPAEGGPGAPLMSRHFSDDYDEWAEGPSPATVTGSWTSYLSASQRITVDGTNYALQMDGSNVDVTVVVNDDSVTYVSFSSVFNSLKDEAVTLTFNSDDEVRKIEATLDTYVDVSLSSVDTVEGEEDFGTITASCYTLDVDDDTVIYLDGERLTLAALEMAFDDFIDYWETDYAIATVRTVGNEMGNGKTVIWLSVITDNIVEGEVTGKGTDSTGPYVRLDGMKYHYLNPLVAADFTIGEEYTVLLDSQDRARSILEVPLSIEPSEFFGMLIDFEVDVDDNGIATFEWSDGTEHEYSYDATVWTLFDIDLVHYVVHDGMDFSTCTIATGATQAISNQELLTVTDTYIRTSDGITTTTLVLSDSVFAYDGTHVESAELVGMDVDVYVDSNDRVGFIIVP